MLRRKLRIGSCCIAVHERVVKHLLLNVVEYFVSFYVLKLDLLTLVVGFGQRYLKKFVLLSGFSKFHF